MGLDFAKKQPITAPARSVDGAKKASEPRRFARASDAGCTAPGTRCLRTANWTEGEQRVSLLWVKMITPRIMDGLIAKMITKRTLGRENQCMCGTKVKTAWDAAHLGSQTNQCNQV